MESQVKFGLHVESHDGYYGVTLYVDDDQLDVTPCYRSCFQGEKGRDTDEVQELFAQSHQEAMDEVGLQGEVEREQYESLLLRSVLLAGEKMEAFGLRPVPFDDVPSAALYCLFAEALPDGENSPGSSALN